jgi:hypothetical protein
MEILIILYYPIKITHTELGMVVYTCNSSTVILALRRLRQEDGKLKANPVRPYLINRKITYYPHL